MECIGNAVNSRAVGFPRVLYIGREVAPMTAADIILIFIGIIGLLITFGSFVIALLAFLDRDKDHKRKK